MTITKHALNRINERITRMDIDTALYFTKNEINEGTKYYTLWKGGRKVTKVVNKGVVYVIDDSIPGKPVLITVYLKSKENEQE